MLSSIFHNSLTTEETYQYYEVRNYVNDVNKEHTQVLQTYDNALNPRHSYTYGHERLSDYNHQTQQTTGYLTNQSGSVVGLTHQGKGVGSVQYGAFGGIVKASGSLGQFSGGRTKPYYRVSIPNKGSTTVNGMLSSEKALTHIDVTENLFNEIIKILDNFRR